MPRRSLPIRQLPSGRWQARPAGIDPASFDSYEDAEAWCLERLRDRARGTAPAKGTARITFAEYAEEWAEAQPWSPATRERVDSNLRNHLYPAIGKVPLARLRPTQIQGVITALTERLAPSTVGTVAQHLSQVLNGAVADGIRHDNPAARVRLPRPDGKPIVVPSDEQVHGLAEAIHPASRALVAVGAGLGLRQGEALALAKPAVDFLRQVVHVRSQLRVTSEGRVLIEDTTKTGMARTVPLPEVVADELAAHVANHDTAHPDGLLFTSAQGMKIRPAKWNERVWRPAADVVELRAGFHSLRHFCATTLLRRGVSVAAVARTLGNRPTTVMQYYAHWVADDTDVIRNVLNDVLANSPKGSEQQAVGEA